MRTCHRSLRVASLAVVALLAGGAKMPAQDNHLPHLSRIGAPRTAADASTRRAEVSVPANLYPLQASFIADYPVVGANADGSDLWPCLDLYLGVAGSNPDCASLGDPSLPLPVGALVTGFPGYSWPLENTPGVGNGYGCDALVNGTTGAASAQYIPCGQILTAYEDDTGDFSDDLLQRVVVTQGTNVIYDSGTVDYPPAGPEVNYPVSVILNYDANFGFWPGASSGPNNGNCSPDVAYPLAAAANPGHVYVVKAGRTCQEPVQGTASIKTTTVLATPSYTEVTGARCTVQGVASPCYLVHWTEKYEIRQNWNIFLR